MLIDGREASSSATGLISPVKRRFLLCFFLVCLGALPVRAVPSPTISGLSPFSATAGGPAFTLTVSGTNFVSGSTVQWGTTALTTTFVSSTQLTASVTAAQIATPGAVNMTVVNPGPVTSAASAFTILTPTGQTWQLLTTSGGPPAGRFAPGAVFDSATRQMVMFGGYSFNATPPFFNDTWSLNTATNLWSQLAPAGTLPPARFGHSTVYDRVNSVMTIFGGGINSPCVVNDVWTLSNANGSAGTPAWTQLNPTGTAPAPRVYHQAVFDPGSDRMIVFGGTNCMSTVYYNDVWVLTNANGLGGTPAWVQLAPTGTPPAARQGASAVYDPASNEMIVFGGFNGGEFSDLWILSNANGVSGTPAWTQVTPAGGAIPARGFQSAVYDSVSNRMTVFGGLGVGDLSDIWVLTNANNLGGPPTWTQLAPSGTAPVARTAPAAILDTTTNRMIVFGGWSITNAMLNDTWALTDANDVMPSIISLSPNPVVAGGPAFTLTVNGQGFAPGAVVQWNGTALATTPGSPASTQLIASVPANLIAGSGTANVTVVNPGGAASGASTFTIMAPPTISGLSPFSATAGGPAFTLTVSGTNFVAGSTVQWGAAALATTFVSSTQLTASVTAAEIAAAGPVSVTVTDPGPVTSNAASFAVLAPTGQSWQLLTTSGGPPAARFAPGAVFDPATTQMVVFGGFNASALNDTWSLNTATNRWSQLGPAGAVPPARWGHSTVYDSANSVMTIFGGESSIPCVPFNDVWTLSNANSVAGTPTWTQLSPTGAAPSPRSYHQAVYDPGKDRMIVFGGNNCTSGASYNDIWVLTNANGLGGTPAWMQLAPTGTPPSARQGASAVYDPTSNEMIVFGGFYGTSLSNGAPLSDVWILSNANGVGGTPAWTQVTPAGGAIPARAFHTAVYDSASNRMTVFGGSGGEIGLNDTWVLTNANNLGGTPTWTQLAPSGTLPAARIIPTAILDPTTNRMIVFGGWNSSFVPLNDTWALSDANDVMPSITSLSPNPVVAGGPAFTLTVNGQGFAPGAVVHWNGTALATTPGSPASTQLRALVPANLIAGAGMANVTVVNPGGATSGASTLTVTAPVLLPLSITSGAPPNGTVNSAYGPFTFTGSGGSGSYSWAVSGIPGLTVNSATGVLSGTPTSAGNNLTLTVTLTDTSSNQSISQNYSVTIALPLAITTSSLPNGTVNQPYNAPLTATGGSGSYTFTVSGIAGLTVNPGSNLISGRPSVGGNLTLTVMVRDTMNPSATPASRQYQVSIAFAPLTITSSGALGGFAPGATVSAVFAATGGSPAYAWSATAVPSGLTLNPATGQLTGTAPAQPGNYTFPLKVSDSETPAASNSITVAFSVLGFTTPLTLPSGTTSTSYSLNFIGAGGTPPYTFSSPGVPAGLALTSSGFLNGTPAATGTFSFTVKLTDMNNLSASASFSLTIATGVQPIRVTGLALPDGTATTSYSQVLEAQDGQPPYAWTVIGGALPAGLVLSGTGRISGTPTMTGLATFTARATDSSGGFAAGVFTIMVDPAPLQVSAATLPNAIVGLPYEAQPIGATGGVPPYTFAITQGSLPSPLTFGAGQINRGVPAAAGTSSFTVTVTDSSAAGDTASGVFTLVVEPTQSDLILSEGSVSFSIVTNAAALPPAAEVTVGSSVATATSYNVLITQETAPGNWLDVTPSGTTAGTIAISLDPTNAPKLPPGNYTATVTVACAPFGPCSGTHNIAVSLAVTAPAPQLTLGATLLSFSATGAGSQTLPQPLALQNTGGGTVTIQSVSAADPWVTFDPTTIPPPPIALAAGQTVQVNVSANTAGLSAPGYYQSTITVTSDAGSASIPVTLLFAANATMTLSPAGSQFLTVAGNPPGNPKGSFLVSVSGNSPVSWTAAVLPTAPAPTWLTLNTTSGSSTAANPGMIGFSINSAAAALAPQTYYARIEVAASPNSVADPVQDYNVVLNVTPSTNIAQPNPAPQGLIFISAAPGALPAQIVQVFDSSAGVNYSATSDSPAWLSVSPASGMTSAAAPAQSSVSVNAAGLASGVFRGGINYSIAGQVQTVNVTLIVESAAMPAISGKAVSPACTPSQLIPTHTGLVNNFSVPAAWPTPLEITVVDDCGNFINDGQVVTTFSTGDPPLVLPPVGAGGVYSGTWTPRATGSQVTITAQALAPGFKAASAQITGEVTRNAAPVLNLGGTLNAFIPKLGAPVAPGMIVQIYGSNLASQVTLSSTIPLTTSLNDTTVLIGGLPAPLYYVSPGQINAQVPFELVPGSQYQVIANANGALSTPIPIQIATDAPGIAAYPSGGIIAQHGDGSLVTDASPAMPGEYIVFYVSGMGPTNNPVASGTASPSSPLASPTDTPTLTLNGVNVPIAFAGLTPTLVGLYQVNFQVPTNAPNGDLQLVLTQTGGQSNTTVLPVRN